MPFECFRTLHSRSTTVSIWFLHHGSPIHGQAMSSPPKISCLQKWANANCHCFCFPLQGKPPRIVSTAVSQPLNVPIHSMSPLVHSRHIPTFFQVGSLPLHQLSCCNGFQRGLSDVAYPPKRFTNVNTETGEPTTIVEGLWASWETMVFSNKGGDILVPLFCSPLWWEGHERTK